MLVDEIVLPITEPETEWVRGRALQEMSPTRDHSRLQSRRPQFAPTVAVEILSRRDDPRHVASKIEPRP